MQRKLYSLVSTEYLFFIRDKFKLSVYPYFGLVRLNSKPLYQGTTSHFGVWGDILSVN